MSDLFNRRMALRGTTVGQSVKKHSDAIMAKTMLNTDNSSMCRLYDWNMNLLDTVPVKYFPQKTFSALGDQVEHIVQFAPGYHPEKLFTDSSIIVNEPRLGYYIELPDEDGTLNLWLIIGRSQDRFTLYSVLKCNWIFKWIKDGVIKTCRGVLRDKSNYTSPSWSADLINSVDNQTMFFVPANEDTYNINYDQRFMITANAVNPDVFSVSKIVSVFPVGCIKIVLTQVRESNNDDIDALLADYYKSKITPIAETEINTEIVINGSSTIKCGGFPKVYSCAFFNNELQIQKEYTWSFVFTEGQEESIHVIYNDNGTISIKCDKDFTLIGTTFTIVCTSNDNVIGDKEVEVVSK